MEKRQYSPKMVGGELNIHMTRNEAQFSSVTQSCPNLCGPVGCSTPGLPVLHFHIAQNLLKLMSIVLMKSFNHLILCSVQSFSHVRLFATPWTAARQASLSITNSWSLLKLMSIKLVMPSNHLNLCRPLLLFFFFFIFYLFYFIFFICGGFCHTLK